MFLHLEPRPPLSKYVRLLWYYEGYCPPSPRERLLPTGTVEIVFDLSGIPSRIYRDDQDASGQVFAGSLICGPHSRYFVLDTSKPKSVAGIHFGPGGASQFLRVPLDEMRDQHVPLDTLWGRAAAVSIRDQMFEASTPEGKLRILERELYARAVRPWGEMRHPAVEYAVGRFSAVPQLDTIDRVATKMSLSARRFIQLFREETGLTPKLFCRVFRFQAAITQANGGGSINWSHVAADCGYFDQPHFIHDFRAFSGISPGAYEQLRGPNLNHVPLVD